MRLLLLPILCGASLLAQSAISGRVVQSPSGEPMPNAHVQVRSGGPDPVAYGAMTKDDGTFTIDPIAAGSYAVYAIRTGFAAEPMEVAIARGQRTEDLEVKMVRRGVITGRVMDERGQPVEDVEIAADPIPGVDPTTPLHTNDRGEFRFSVPPGAYRLRAGPATHYPDPIEVGSGETSRPAVIVLRALSAVNINGVVKGGSLNFSVAMLRGKDGFYRQVSVESAKGTFAFGGIPPGEYLLEAGENNLNRHAGPVDLVVGTQDVSVLELVFRDPVSVTGRVQGVALPPGTKVVLTPVGHTAYTVTVPLQAEGRFEANRVAANRYRVSVRNLPEHLAIKRVRVDGRGVPNATVNLPGLSDRPTIEIEVEAKP